MRRDFVGEGEQRRASDRSVCFPDATGVSSGPGRSPAQRVTSARSVRACKGSRSTGGALTRICVSVLIAVVRALTALSRATLSCRIISTAPSAVLGRRGGLPREHRAGGRLSVDSVRLARGSTQTPIDSIHFHDPMTRAVDRTGQADAVAACRSRIRHQAAAGSWTMPRQWEIQRTWLNSARAAVRSPAKPNGV